MGLRFIRRAIPHPSQPDEMIEANILQQQFQTPHGDRYWRDVPLVVEDVPQ
jgi:hypothetical protein